MDQLPRLNLPRNFSLNKANNKGLIFDEIWKNACLEISERFEIPPELDAPFDACLDHGHYVEYFDVKLIPTKDKSYFDCYVYMSHNEYLFGKKHDTRFVCYVEDGDIAELLIIFSFSGAKEMGAIELFDKGRWVHCKETGKLEAPWSINVSRILQKSVSPP